MGTFSLLHNQIRLNINETSRRRIFARTKARVILLKGNYFINITGEMSETKVRFSSQDHTMTVNTPIGMHLWYLKTVSSSSKLGDLKHLMSHFLGNHHDWIVLFLPFVRFFLQELSGELKQTPLFLRIWLQHMILGPLSYRDFRETGPKSRDTTRFPRFSPTRVNLINYTCSFFTHNLHM